jgi:AraC-like DNA-binding protein
MSTLGYLLDDIADLLVKYAHTHNLHANKKLMQRLGSYGKERNFKFEDWQHHLDELSEITQNPGIGLELGQLAEIKHGGILGYLISSSENLGQASLQFARYQSILNGVEPELSAQNSAYRITWPALEEPGYRSDECLVAAMINLARQLTGKYDFYPTEIGFQHSKPSYIEEYHELLGDNILFNVHATYIEYPPEYLALPIQQADPNLQKILKQQADSLLTVLKSQDDFESQLRDAILTMLNTGEPSLKKLTQIMGIPSRTLQRRLEKRNISFSELLENCRKQLAKDYLKNETLSLTEISFLLAYSEQSAFTRAFKKWFSTSPKNYRKQLNV